MSKLLLSQAVHLLFKFQEVRYTVMRFRFYAISQALTWLSSYRGFKLYLVDFRDIIRCASSAKRSKHGVKLGRRNFWSFRILTLASIFTDL